MKLSDLPEQQVQEICEAFAKMEGVYKNIPVYKKIWNSSYTDYREVQDGYRNPRSDELSDYPNDKNAMGRIIAGMDDNTITEYSMNLYCVDGTMDGKLKATAHQQFVAAALALGLVKEEK